MKTALVTGANRGLGFELSRQLGKKGYKVYMGSRNLDKGLKAAESLGNEGLDVEVISLDVTKSADVKSAVDKIKKESGHLDVLVNNAGVMLDTGDDSNSALKVDPVIVLKTMEVNLTGPLRTSQAFAPLMSGRDARIINFSSGMGQLSEMGGGWAAYRTSKTALNALTKILSNELESYSISVNSVCPGWVKTDMGGEAAPRMPEEGVAGALRLATMDSPPTGKFFRDDKEIDW